MAAAKTKKQPKLDWLAENACAVLDQTCGKDYGDSKRHRLDGLDRFRVLVWLNELDIRNLELLAARLNVNPSDLDVTRNTARSL
jgi:hypothetical protein